MTTEVLHPASYQLILLRDVDFLIYLLSTESHLIKSENGIQEAASFLFLSQSLSSFCFSSDKKNISTGCSLTEAS